MKNLKLILPIFLFCIMLSGCSPSNTIDETKASNNFSNFNSNEIESLMNQIKNGLTPKVKPTGKSESADSTGQEQTQGQNQVQLEDLASQYAGAILKTNYGDIQVAFYGDESPITVNNFLNLAKKGFYDGTRFHRVMADFMIQGGDPNSKDDDWSNDGTGGPGYQFQDEINDHKLVRGSLAMANSSANTNGSQFFIVTAESTPWLDGKHTNFGYVVSGMDIVDKIEQVKTNENDHPLEDVTVESIELLQGSQIETEEEILNESGENEALEEDSLSKETPSREDDAKRVAEDMGMEYATSTPEDEE